MTPDDRDRLARIDRRGHLHTMWFAAITVWLVVLTAAVFGQSNEVKAAANADRAKFPQSDWPYLYYLSSDHLPADKQLTAGRTAAFVVSSFSRSVVLEQHLPAEVTRGLWRIDLRQLQWRWQDWHAVLKRYPYNPEAFPPLIVRADWLSVTLTDNFASDSGYRLLYGASVPKTRDEFLKFWQVSLKSSSDPLLLARVEKDTDGDSPSLLDVRRIENRPVANRGYAWGTEDNASSNFNATTDPLESLLGNRAHDAEEWIVGFPKISSTQGAGGMAQAYLLSNGKGVRQDRAPTEIVKDANAMRGDTAIRNTIGCIACHPRGINPLAENDLRELIRNGVELYADKKSQQLIEAQYLADVRLRVEIARNQDDYAVFTALAAGWGPEENARAFVQLVEDYDAALDLDSAARELHLTPDNLRLALGYASEAQYKLGARLAALAHGGTVERAYWESSYPTAYAAAKLWRKAVK